MKSIAKPLCLGGVAFVALSLVGTPSEALEMLRTKFKFAFEGTIGVSVATIVGFLQKYLQGDGTPQPPTATDPNPPQDAENNEQLLKAYHELSEWSKQAQEYIDAASPLIEKLKHRQELLRLFIAAGLGVALASSFATFVAPPTESQQMHFYFLLGAYGVSGLLCGAFAHLRLSVVEARHLIRLGFLAPFYVNVVALLISVGYSYKRLIEMDALLFTLAMPLPVYMGLMRLIVLPLASLIGVYVGSKLAKLFFSQG